MINVTDLETCGMEAGVVEIACVAVGDTIEFTEDGFMQSLVNPEGVPISFEAMACHHIVPDMVKDAKNLESVIEEYGLQAHDVWCAHNAEFDRKCFPEAIRTKKWIDTWRCALHLWPGAPGHGNQVLRYWLNLDVSDMPETAGSTPHRALYDAWCTAKLLRRMLDVVKPILRDQKMLGENTPILESEAMDELIRLSSTPVVLRKVRFGKYRDSLWSDVDKGYLRWCLGQKDMDPDVHHTCRHYLGMLV